MFYHKNAKCKGQLAPNPLNTFLVLSHIASIANLIRTRFTQGRNNLRTTLESVLGQLADNWQLAIGRHRFLICTGAVRPQAGYETHKYQTHIKHQVSNTRAFKHTTKHTSIKRTTKYTSIKHTVPTQSIKHTNIKHTTKYTSRQARWISGRSSSAIVGKKVTQALKHTSKQTSIQTHRTAHKHTETVHRNIENTQQRSNTKK